MEWLPVFLKLSALWLPHGIFQSLLRGLFLLHSRIEKLLSIVFAHLLLWLLLLVLILLVLILVVLILVVLVLIILVLLVVDDAYIDEALP